MKPWISIGKTENRIAESYCISPGYAESKRSCACTWKQFCEKVVPKNIAASVHQRLLNQARETGRPFEELLQYFAMERFLYRLSQSRYRDSFILKGALLFRVWAVADTRATRDMDFLAYVDNSLNHLVEIVQSTASLEVPDDGLVFDSDSVAAERIKEDADYEGVRIRFRAFLGQARVTLQVDVGFGDVVHPDVAEIEYPTLLDFPSPALGSLLSLGSFSL